MLRLCSVSSVVVGPGAGTKNYGLETSVVFWVGPVGNFSFLFLVFMFVGGGDLFCGVLIRGGTWVCSYLGYVGMLGGGWMLVSLFNAGPKLLA